jgi:nucleoside-diphosphate-sugar epimerase
MLPDILPDRILPWMGGIPVDNQPSKCRDVNHRSVVVPSVHFCRYSLIFMAVYLVTGGAGFIGSHLVGALVQRGEDVRVLDDFSAGKEENLEPFLDHIEVIEGDILNRDRVRKAFKGVDYVLHHAALLPNSSVDHDPLAIYEVNVGGTINILFAAREEGVKRVVHASSFLVYGKSPELPKRESMEPKPASPYAESKLSSEQACQAFSYGYGLKTICLRYSSVFGPGQPASSLYTEEITHLVEGIIKEQPLTIAGDEKQPRDYTFVENVVEASLLAIKKKGVVSGRVFNIGGGESLGVNQIIESLCEILGKRISVKYIEEPSDDFQSTQVDIKRASAAFGYQPTVSTLEGLTRLVAWYQDQEN